MIVLARWRPLAGDAYGPVRAKTPRRGCRDGGLAAIDDADEFGELRRRKALVRSTRRGLTV